MNAVTELKLMNRAFALRAMRRAKRCGAQTRNGQPCRGPAVRGQARCRMHGGGVSKKGRGPGAPKGNRNAVTHGLYTLLVLKERRLMRRMMKEAEKVLRGMGGGAL